MVLFNRLAAVGAALFFVGATSASAATMTCGTDVGGKVTVNIGCEVSDTASQDFLNPPTVNTEEFFGPEDWTYIGKNEFGSADGEAPTLGIGSDEQSGDFTILSSLWDDYGQIMAIFKSGNGTFLTGYLLNTGDTSFDYDSPFISSKNPKDISHITLYGRGDLSTVPLPAAGWMLIAGIGGLFAWRRRAA